MKCPVCGARLRVIDSRCWDGNLVVRKRVCPKCSFETITTETLEVDKED